jgi:hypothetical protein
MVSDADVHGDGVISREEFSILLHRAPPAKRSPAFISGSKASLAVGAEDKK